MPAVEKEPGSFARCLLAARERIVVEREPARKAALLKGTLMKGGGPSRMRWGP